MGKLQKNQSGFSAIEAILILVIIIVIGGVGYYVYNSRNKTDNTLNTTVQTNTTVPAVKYVTISQWGVRAPYSGSLTMQYTIDPSNPNSVLLTSAQLVASDIACNTDSAKFMITRYHADDQVVGELAANGGTAAQVAANVAKTQYTYIGDYYYFGTGGPQANCGTSQASISAQQQTALAVDAILQQLEAVK